MKAYYFHGSSGSVSLSLLVLIFGGFSSVNVFSYFCVSLCSENITTEEIPGNMETIVAEKRRELIEAVSEVDDNLAEAFLSDEPISSTELEVC